MSFRLEHEARALVWEVPDGWVALSSASVGGGLTWPRWVANVDVGDAFRRTDLAAYAAGRASELGLDGPGTTLLTAADVRQVEHAEVEGVRCWATVGVTKPTWPVPPVDEHQHGDAAPQGTRTVGEHPGPAHDGPPPPGTINLVVASPVPLSVSALVQAVGTTTEAKAQVLVQAGVPGTGTASDAVVVLCPDPSRSDGAAEAFAGVRSVWGRRVAAAVHATVAAGLAAHPWRPGGSGRPGVVW